MACDQVIDYYEGSNDASEVLWFQGDYIGQAFLMGATPRDICKASFYHNVEGSAPLDVDAAVRIYACSGTPGIDGQPTGGALATSDIIKHSSDRDAAWVTYTFSTPFTLEANTAYCVVLEFIVSDMDVLCYTYYDNTSPTHDGNYVEKIAGTPTYYADRDCNFFIYYYSPDEYIKRINIENKKPTYKLTTEQPKPTHYLTVDNEKPTYRLTPKNQKPTYRLTVEAQ